MEAHNTDLSDEERRAAEIKVFWADLEQGDKGLR